MARSKRKYGFGHLLLAILLTAITGGAWFAAIVILHLRRNS